MLGLFVTVKVSGFLIQTILILRLSSIFKIFLSLMAVILLKFYDV